LVPRISTVAPLLAVRVQPSAAPAVKVAAISVPPRFFLERHGIGSRIQYECAEGIAANGGLVGIDVETIDACRSLQGDRRSVDDAIAIRSVALIAFESAIPQEIVGHVDAHVSGTRCNNGTRMDAQSSG